VCLYLICYLFLFIYFDFRADNLWRRRYNAREDEEESPVISRVYMYVHYINGRRGRCSVRGMTTVKIFLNDKQGISCEVNLRSFPSKQGNDMIFLITSY